MTIHGISETKIIYHFAMDYLRSVNIFDFLPNIQKQNINDLEILLTWMTHFQKHNISYFVEDCGEFMILWKECHISQKEEINEC